MFQISKKKKNMYFRTRKTASSSITKILEKYDIINVVQTSILDPKKRIFKRSNRIFYEHSDPLQIKLLFNLDNYFKIISIRNPLTMIKSMFFWTHRNKTLSQKNIKSYFLKWMRKKDYENIKKNDIFFKYNKYNFVIRYEFLKDDLKKLLNHFEIYDYILLDNILNDNDDDNLKKNIKKYDISYEKKDIKYITNHFKKFKILSSYFNKD